MRTGLATAPWSHTLNHELPWTLPQPAPSFLYLLGVDPGLWAGDGSWKPQPACGAGPGHGASLLDGPPRLSPSSLCGLPLLAVAFAPKRVPSTNQGTEIPGCSRDPRPGSSITGACPYSGTAGQTCGDKGRRLVTQTAPRAGSISCLILLFWGWEVGWD